MTAATWKMIRRFSADKMVVGLTLASFFTSGIGLPLPASRFKDKSVPFPCQDHACGCGSAEQCWQHCCCFTVQERWAWARDHAVEPPSYAEQLPTHDSREQMEQPVQCCHHHESHPPLKRSSGTKAVGFSALHCRGLATLWSGVILAIPPAPVCMWSPSLLSTGRIHPPDSSASSIVINLLDPPPR
jgi:hypothetical protein